MSDAPERIWATEDKDNFGEDRFHSTRPMQGLTEYVRRDPAVLAALPEVQALIAAAIEAAADLVREYPHIMLMTPDQKLVCNHLGDAIRRHPRAASADATAALARIEREAEARGRGKGLREAAAALMPTRGATLPYQQAAILARAAEIEKDAK